MIRLAFSTNAYLRFSFDEAADGSPSLGYEGLELMADVPHAWPAGLLARAEAGRSATAMARNGLAFSNVNAFMMNAINDHRQPYWYPSFIEPEPNYRQVRIDHTRRALSLCAELGAPTSRPSRAGRSPRGRRRQEAIDLFVEVLKPLAEHAHEVGRPAPDRARAGPAAGDDRPVPRGRRAGERPVDRPELRRRPRLLRERGPARRRSPSSPPTSGTTTSRTSPPTRVHHHLVPGHRRDRLRRGVRARSAQTGYDGWLTVELYPFVDDPDAAARAGVRGPPAAARLGPAWADNADRWPIKPYLQLVRLPNVFTAAADSLAGWLLVRRVVRRARTLGAARPGVDVHYAGGIVLNDVLRLRDRPRRASRAARFLRAGSADGSRPSWAAGLLVAGLVLAAVSRIADGLVVAAALIGCVLAYDAGLKRTALGPEVMGACRGLNLLLGMSQAAQLGGPGVAGSPPSLTPCS